MKRTADSLDRSSRSSAPRSPFVATSSEANAFERAKRSLAMSVTRPAPMGARPSGTPGSIRIVSTGSLSTRGIRISCGTPVSGRSIATASVALGRYRTSAKKSRSAGVAIACAMRPASPAEVARTIASASSEPRPPETLWHSTEKPPAGSSSTRVTSTPKRIGNRSAAAAGTACSPRRGTPCITVCPRPVARAVQVSSVATRETSSRPRSRPDSDLGARRDVRAECRRAARKQKA